MCYRTGPSTGPTYLLPAAWSSQWPTTACWTGRRRVATRAPRGRCGCGATTSTKPSSCHPRVFELSKPELPRQLAWPDADALARDHSVGELKAQLHGGCD